MSHRLETFRDWVSASTSVRTAEMPGCLARIQELDASLHAWVNVKPQPATGDGPLGEIPFGVKEIIETKGLLTEYGSLLYRGRVGTEDAAIVGLLRQRGGVLLGKT